MSEMIRESQLVPKKCDQHEIIQMRLIVMAPWWQFAGDDVLFTIISTEEKENGRFNLVHVRFPFK